MAYAVAQTPTQAPNYSRSNDMPANDNGEEKVDLAQKRRWFRAYEENKRDEITEQQEADRYYHAKQWTEREIAELRRRGQPPITANRIQRKIDFLVGVEQRMRRDPKAYARNPQDTETADVVTAALRYVCDNNRWEFKASAGTSDGLRRGVGAVWIGIEPNKRGQLEVKVKKISADRFFYDPRSVQEDFSDARYMGVHLWLDIDEAKEQFPGVDFDKYMQRDGGATTFAVEEDRAEQWGDFEHRRVRIVEMWYKKEGAWYYCKFCGDLEIESGKSPYLDDEGATDCPYLPWSPYIDEKGIRYGLIRNMRSIQDEINHRRSKALHEINSRQMHMRTGVVDDIDETRKEAAKTDGLIIHNGDWNVDVGFVDRSKEMQGNLEMLVEAKQEIENLGPNPGLIGAGQGVDGASGRALSMQRDSGMTELQPVFDHNRDWKLRCYRAMYHRIRQAWTGERWIRITDNPEAPKYIGINQVQMDPMSGQFSGQNMIGEVDVDIILEEGPDTIVANEELYQTLAQLGEAAMSPIGRVLIELSNVPQKARILELMDQAGQPSQADQQAAEQTLRGNEAKIATEEAKAEETRAKAAKMIAELEAMGFRLPVELEHQQAQTAKTYADAELQAARLPADLAQSEAQTFKTVTDAMIAARPTPEQQAL